MQRTYAYELMVNLAEPNSAVDISRLFIYYNSRLQDGTTGEDVGAALSDSMKAMTKYGACTEELWPYDPDKFDQVPSDECYQDGIKRRIVDSRRVKNLSEAIAELNANNPVIFGISIYKQFHRVSSEDAVVDMPLKSKQSSGNHAMCMVGYDQERQLILAKNSFGLEWGDQGYGWIPYDYIREHGSDMWVFDI